MKIGEFFIFIDGKHEKTYDGKEVKNFILNWDGKLSEGKVLETTDGNMKVVSSSLKPLEQSVDTEIFLERL
jgi:hypothetical protein